MTASLESPSLVVKRRELFIRESTQAAERANPQSFLWRPRKVW